MEPVILTLISTLSLAFNFYIALRVTLNSTCCNENNIVAVDPV